jgi:hypothetical protein
MKEGKNMIFGIKNRNILSCFGFLIAVVVTLTMGIAFGGVSKGKQKQKTFPSPDEAVKAVVAAEKNSDDKELLAIFGPAANDLLFSGDAVADKLRRERFLKAYEEKNSIVPEKNTMLLVVGTNNWPFPIPLVKQGETWSFDTKKGKEEILNRRIGENELSTIQTCLAIVDAQREYAINDLDGQGTHEYAQKFFSSPGKKNGLYWETKEGETPSPLGLLAAEAQKEGYSRKNSGDKPSPFHGYYYRILKAQGKNAPGGAYDYVVDGKMIGGFALVAFPAKYGNSGVMSFIVSDYGIVYQKNLGKNTDKIAESMKAFDPDKTWQRVEDKPKP